MWRWLRGVSFTPPRGSGRLLLSSWMWHFTRWDGLFLGTYLVTYLGGDPIANQFVGVAMFAPMVLGASFGPQPPLG